MKDLSEERLPRARRLPRAAVAVVMASALVSVAEAQAQWTLRESTGRPSSRRSTAMAWDSVRDVVVLFGGIRSTSIKLNDTWEWNGEFWLFRGQGVVPLRSSHAMAYDPVRGQTVLFGGLDNGTGYLADTWLWDGSAWTQYLGSGPPARDGHTMVWDETRSAVLLWGGRSPGGLLGDLWAWDGTAWSLLAATGAPIARRNHGAVYDGARQRMVGFGGQTSAGPAVVNEVWELDSATSSWTQPTPSPAPTGRWHMELAYDPVRQRTVMFGGELSGGGELNDTWEWDGSAWTQALPATSPPARQNGAMVWDGSGVLLFGGVDQTSQIDFGDLWTWDGTDWTAIPPSAFPSVGVDREIVYDATNQRTLLLAGTTWLWDGFDWTPQQPLNTFACGLAHDPLRQVVLAFGGTAGNINATWNGTAWTQLPTAGLPPARIHPAMAFDAARGTVILWAGRVATSAAFLADTWEWNGAGWAQLIPFTQPPGRFGHALVADGGGRLVGFGGQTSTGVDGGTWVWANNDWSLQAPATSPPGRLFHSMAYDAVRDRVVMHGGQGLSAETVTWEWDGNDWSSRSSGALGFQSNASGMAFDSARGVVVYAVPSQVWESSTDALATVVAFGAGCAGSAGVPTLAPQGSSRPWIGDTFVLDIANLDPVQALPFGVLGLSNTQLAGGVPLPLDLTLAGFPGCTAYVSIDLTAFLFPSGGAATWALPIPNDPQFPGVALYFQSLVFDAGAVGGIALTNAVAAVIGAR